MTDLPWVSARYDAETILGRLRELLPAGERVAGVFGVTKVHPAYDICVLTDQRVRVGYLDLFDRDGWRIDLHLEDLERVEVTGFMDNIRLVRRDGTSIKIGNLTVDDDIDDVFLEVFARAQRGDTGPPEPPGAPTYEVWRP